MIRNYRVKRLLAPTIALRTPVLAVLAGFFLLVSGIVLSFRQQIAPGLDRFAGLWTNLLAGVVSESVLEDAGHLLGGILLVFGGYLVYRGVRGSIGVLVGTLGSNSNEENMVNTFLRKQQLAQGPRIVAIGGGTGLSTLLRGLKQYSSNITAVVTVTDDGGSSGRLVKDLGIIPPGDIRNCLVALADAEKLMTDLFQHRFKKGAGGLSGHSLGNLLIAGLFQQCDGDYDRALSMASEVLAIRGRVVPTTVGRVDLSAEMDDGTTVVGETAIAGAQHRIRRIHLVPEAPDIYPEVVDAIREADLVVIGPGSVFTSVIPNLLVPGIVAALGESQAKKAYVCNVMTQRGESDSFTAAEHVAAIQANISSRAFDYVLVNNGSPTSVTLEKYRGSDQFIVAPDVDRIKAMGFRVVQGNFLNESDVVRHDPFKVAQRLIDLLDQ